MQKGGRGGVQSHSSVWRTRSKRRAKMKLLPVKKKAGSLIHPQQLNQNHNNMMMGTSRWHRFSPCNPAHLSNPDSVFKDEFDSQLLSPRTFYDSEYSPTDWSMKSLLAALHHSPSPVCSPCESPSASAPAASLSPSLDAFSSQISKELSAQTNKSSCTASDINKRSAARYEIDEWMEHANDFFQPHLQNHQPGGMDDENSIVKLPSTCEERGLGDSRGVDKVVDIWSPITGDGRVFLTRPKPYHAFLDEIQKKEAEAQADASRKAAQMKFLKELKGKEAAIREWESRQTRTAMTQMKKIEGELEKKRTKALEEMRKKISKAHSKAIQKKVKERRSVLKKISRAIEVAEIEATKRSTKFLGLARIC